MGQSTMTLSEIHAIQMDMLRVLTMLCEQHGLKYYIVGGTLLGAIRHGGFIPWDDDVDIAMPRPDYDRLLDIASSVLPTYYAIIDYRVEPQLPHVFAKLIDRRTELWETGYRPACRPRIGVYVDIFPLDGVPKSAVMKWLHYGVVRTLRWLLVGFAVDADQLESTWARLVARLLQRVMTSRQVEALHRWLDRIMRWRPYSDSLEVCNYSGAWGRREFMPKAWFGEGRKVQFGELSVTGVAEFDAYLSRLYGDYRKLPPAEMRKPQHRFVVRRAGQSVDTMGGANEA